MDEVLGGFPTIEDPLRCLQTKKSAHVWVSPLFASTLKGLGTSRQVKVGSGQKWFPTIPLDPLKGNRKEVQADLCP